MTDSLASANSLLLTIVLAMLAVAVPIVTVLAIRFLWDRSLHLGRSKELEKLIWQLHRIASALEHQMNLSFPAVQPGTEEPRDLAYLQQPARQAAVPAPVMSASIASAPARTVLETPQAVQGAAPQQVAQQAAVPPPVPQQQPGEPQRHGVNSMFGL